MLRRNTQEALFPISLGLPAGILLLLCRWLSLIPRSDIQGSSGGSVSIPQTNALIPRGVTLTPPTLVLHKGLVINCRDSGVTKWEIAVLKLCLPSPTPPPPTSRQGKTFRENLLWSPPLHVNFKHQRTSKDLKTVCAPHPFSMAKTFSAPPLLFVGVKLDLPTPSFL